MSKGMITYTDLDGGAPVVTWFGRDFTSTVPLPVDDDADAELIEAAKGNRFFDYKTGKPPAGDTAEDKGRAAAEAGKPRSVPPAYRGKPENDAWLFGFDEYVRQNPPADPGGPSADDHEALAAAGSASTGGVAGVASALTGGEERRRPGVFPKSDTKSE